MRDRRSFRPPSPDARADLRGRLSTQQLGLAAICVTDSCRSPSRQLGHDLGSEPLDLLCVVHQGVEQDHLRPATVTADRAPTGTSHLWCGRCQDLCASTGARIWRRSLCKHWCADLATIRSSARLAARPRGHHQRALGFACSIAAMYTQRPTSPPRVRRRERPCRSDCPAAPARCCSLPGEGGCSPRVCRHQRHQVSLDSVALTE